MENEYPKIVPKGLGYEVQMNSRVTLSGIFTTFIQAEKAISRYNGAMVDYKRANSKRK